MTSLALGSAAVWLKCAHSQLPIRFFRSSLLLLCCAVVVHECLAQTQDVVCRDGSGSFQAEFPNGVAVEVRAARLAELATRACEATLRWNKGKVVVDTNVPQIDVDTFGVDLGLGVPVTTFQVKKSANQCCMEYQVYSLEKPPRLLRAITGGDTFRAADIDLDSRVEIWTHDAAALENFEHLSVAEFDSAPTIVLRFEHSQLLDVSTEFQDYFDREIAAVRKQLDLDGLQDFKGIDGSLFDPRLPLEQLHRLRNVKVKVLQIVWDYLYSGREEEAWGALLQMWPSADVSRIQTAIVSARARGIRAQTAGSSSGPGKRQKKVQIFDAITRSRTGKLEVSPPLPIILRRPAPAATQNKDLLTSKTPLLLVIDSGGKVRSAEPAAKTQTADQDLINAAYSWRFIPAFKDGRPVASRIRMESSARQ